MCNWIANSALFKWSDRRGDLAMTPVRRSSCFANLFFENHTQIPIRGALNLLRCSTISQPITSPTWLPFDRFVRVLVVGALSTYCPSCSRQIRLSTLKVCTASSANRSEFEANSKPSLEQTTRGPAVRMSTPAAAGNQDRELSDKLDQMQLKQKYQSYLEIEEKLQKTTRDNKILQLTLQELREIEGDAKFYESHGRAYVRNYKKEVVNNLESMSKAKSETIENLQKNKEKRLAELKK